MCVFFFYFFIFFLQISNFITAFYNVFTLGAQSGTLHLMVGESKAITAALVLRGYITGSLDEMDRILPVD